MKLFYASGSSSMSPHNCASGSRLAVHGHQIDEHTKVIEGGADYRKVNPLGSQSDLQPSMRIPEAFRHLKNTERVDGGNRSGQLWAWCSQRRLAAALKWEPLRETDASLEAAE